MNKESHPFEPFLPPGARILFLGSFPPQPHRWCMPFYYPNWINDFWRIMGLIHFGDKNHFCISAEKRFDETAIRSFCSDAGLAFYDTACEVRRLRDNASDAFLEVVTPTDIPALLARIPDCRALVTTGEKASRLAADAIGCDIPPFLRSKYLILKQTTPHLSTQYHTHHETFVGYCAQPGSLRASQHHIAQLHRGQAVPLDCALQVFCFPPPAST